MLTDSVDVATPDPTKTKPVKPVKSVDDYKKMFDEFRSTMDKSREQSQIDDDYYHGKQLTDDEVRKLNARGQPDIVINRTRVAVNGILGVVARSATDPKAWPRTQKDEDSASVATDVLRYVTHKSRYNRLKVECSRDFFVPGTAAMMVIVDPDTKDVCLHPIRWEEYFYDPRARRTDLSDRRYDGVAKWMYVDEAMQLYPGKAADMERYEGGGGGIAFGDTFQDRPLNQAWFDPRLKRVMICEMYHKYYGRWKRCVFWHGGILEEGDSPYKNQYGKPCNPIEPVTCYVDRDNNRYGIVRDMRDIQDEINKRRSKLLHIVNSAQIQAKDPSAIEVDADTARKEAARPDGVIPYGWEKVPTQDQAQGQSLLLSEAKGEIERLGPNPAILGRQGADSSGKALLARQQAGLIELAVLLDQLEDWELRIYRAIWCRVKQFWTAPMVIRVTDNEEDPRFIQLNEPIPNPMAGQYMMGPDGAAQLDPQTQQPMVHPAVLGYKNQLAEMDVDIMIDTTPATATIMHEQLEDLMKLMGTNPQYAQQVPFEVVIGLMQIPRKRDLIKQIQAYRDKNAQAQQQQQQVQMQAMMKELIAKIEHMNSQTELNQAKAAKLGADVQKVGAETTKIGIDAHNETAQTVHEVSQEPKEPASGAKSGGSDA